MKELLTTKEAAKFYSVSESTIRRWRRAGRLPYVRMGKGKNGAIRYRLEDLRRIAAELAMNSLERADISERET